MVVTLILSSVALATAIAFWTDRLGYLGVGVVIGLIVAALLAVLVMPETAWTRLTGADTAMEELGRLHEEGVRLRAEFPMMGDQEELDAQVLRLDDWVKRVVSHLEHSAPRWKGMFLSPVARTHAEIHGARLASGYRNDLDDRLERFSQILAAEGGRK